MKKIYGLILLLGGLTLFQHAFAQAPAPQKDTTVQFFINGLCDMCKERLEKVYQRKGIASAVWNPTDRIVHITYDPSVITYQKLHQWAADAGHDTELKKARTAAYNSLPECCRYRDSNNVHVDELREALSQAAVVDSAKDAVPNQVRGIVLSEDRKGNFSALSGASISWLGSSGGAVSDINGIFRIGLPDGPHKLIVSYAGLRPDTVDVSGISDLKIVLSNGTQLKAVEVTARQRSVLVSSMNTVRTQIMTERELFKAACCNLSESFETNPSVDVAYNDAITGSKQIQLLGLSGNYSMLSVENMPGPRGLAIGQGLNYIPGPWIESIQLSKGVGSVANGFESISGQINVELKKPEKADRLFANAYVNDMGKVDLNLALTQKVGAKWSTALLLHDDFYRNRMMDINKDEFRDLPTGNLFTVMNRWKYDDQKGFMVQFGFRYLNDDKTGGMVHFIPSKHKLSTTHYGFGMNTDRKEGFLKIGYVFPGKKYQSIGWQLSAFDHDQESYFGIKPYNARQKNLYSNLIYQSIIGTTAHKFRTGLSFTGDRYDEYLSGSTYFRREYVPGAFFEYTYSYLDKFSLVAGIRADHNSIFGWFATPRLHVRYEPIKGTTFRLAAGRGQRTANVLAENMGIFASSRNMLLSGYSNTGGNAILPEVAMNYGITFDQKFSIGNRNGMLSLDYYYTRFSQQVVTDLEDPRYIRFYNLAGKSYSSSFQAEVNYELVKKLELRMAWRFYDVKTTYNGKLLERPLTARHRAFVNLAYETGHWKFDWTMNRIGTKRIPSTASNPAPYQRPERSPAYSLMNAQVSRSFGKQKLFEVYLGGENLTGFYQKDPIIAANDAFGPYFDASLVWGLVYGRMLYTGLRWRVK